MAAIIAEHASKVSAILKFLEEDSDDGVHMLLLSGAGGTGKTSALREAVERLGPATDESCNIMVWNQGEVPYYFRFSHTSAPVKWVIVRWDGDDAISRGMLDEWDGRVDRMVFVKDPVLASG